MYSSLGWKVVVSKSRTCFSFSACFLTRSKPKPPCFSWSVTHNSGNFCIFPGEAELFCTVGAGQGLCRGFGGDLFLKGRAALLGGLLQDPQLQNTELGCSQWDHPANAQGALREASSSLTFAGSLNGKVDIKSKKQNLWGARSPREREMLSFCLWEESLREQEQP